jgi:Triose-phosphate Transporter family
MSTLSTRGLISLGFKLAINGALAFSLNYVSFTANKKTSPLTMTVAANLKQCLSIILGVWIFRLQVGWMNAAGIMTALGGGAWYAVVELSLKTPQKLEPNESPGKEEGDDKEKDVV